MRIIIRILFVIALLFLPLALGWWLFIPLALLFVLITRHPYEIILGGTLLDSVYYFGTHVFYKHVFLLFAVLLFVSIMIVDRGLVWQRSL